MAASMERQLGLKNFVVLTDFSGASGEALEYAVQWAKIVGATVHVAHFIPAITMATMGYSSEMLLDQMWQNGREGIAMIERGGQLHDVAHAVHLQAGEVVDGLNAMVADSGIDLAFVATAGRHGMQKILLGSTAEAVFRRGDCPVLIFGPACDRRLYQARLRSILFATDFGSGAGHALAHAQTLAQCFGAKLHLLHVLPEHDGPDPKEQEAKSRLAGLAGAPGVEHGEVAVRHGHASEEIVRVANSVTADLVVLGARRPPRLPVYTGWATAYRVITDSLCPVLTVREPG